MTQLEITNGWYIEALPSGEYACLMRDLSVVRTHNGFITTLPKKAPLYVRITNIPEFRFAGQCSDFDNDAIEWIPNSGWVTYGLAFGVSPVIYDNDGLLIIATSKDGTQGFRYVTKNNIIITGDATYESMWRIAEWSNIGDELYIGQYYGPEKADAAAIWNGKELLLLDPDPCRFIRARRDGNNVAIAYWKDGNKPSKIVLATMDELRELPKLNPVIPTTDLIPLMR